MVCCLYPSPTALTIPSMDSLCTLEQLDFKLLNLATNNKLVRPPFLGSMLYVCVVFNPILHYISQCILRVAGPRNDIFFGQFSLGRGSCRLGPPTVDKICMYIQSSSNNSYIQLFYCTWFINCLYVLQMLSHIFPRSIKILP